MTVNQIAECINGKVIGNGDLKITSLRLPNSSEPNSISFITDSNVNEAITKCRADAILVERGVMLPLGKTYIYLTHPIHEILDQIVDIFVKNGLANVQLTEEPEIDLSAVIGKNVSIGAGSKIGRNTIISDNTIIDSNVVIGEGCKILSNVAIGYGTVIGDNCEIGSGSKIGNNGFEYCRRDDQWFIVESIGKTIIGKNVRIGANVCIDRGTIGDTSIGEGTKIDNFVQIGHEVSMGTNCIIMAQTGIAGWASIGNNVMIYAQVGISNSVVIGDNTCVMARSGVTKKINENMVVSGFPAIEHIEELKMMAFQNRLYKRRKD